MEKTGIIYTGCPSAEELANAPGVPSLERMKKGPVAVLECVQCIPCNPCEQVCSFDAITVGDSITNLPVLDVNKCIGCGSCVAACPGQAIFTVNMIYSDMEATVEFPYEYLPIPQKGHVVDAVNRKGEVVCQGTITRVRAAASFVNTRVVQIAVPKEFANEVRSIKRLSRD